MPNADAPERSLAYYLRLGRRHWALILLPGLLAALFGAYAAAGEQEVFRSTATIRIGDPSVPGQGRADVDQALATAIAVIESEPTRRRVFADVDEGLQSTFENVDVTRVEGTVLVDVTVTSTDREGATEMAQAWAEDYVAFEVSRTVGALTSRAEEITAVASTLDAEIDQIEATIIAAAQESSDDLDVLEGSDNPALTGLTQQRDALLDQQQSLRSQASELRVEAALQSNAVDIAFPAEAAGGPYRSQPLRSAFAAGVLGLLLGSGLAVAREQFDDRIRDRDQLEGVSDVPVLAGLPGRVRRRRGRPVVLKPDERGAEAFRALRTNFEFIASTRIAAPGQGALVVVTSPLDGEGKSTTAVNLASSLGSLGYSVVLVDADLRRGRLHEFFGIPARPGLVDVFEGGRSMDEALHGIPLEGAGHLFVVRGGRHAKPGELFARKEFATFFSDLRAMADYVIVDAPPTLPVSDALVLGRLSDGALVVVAAKRSRRGNIEAALEAIEVLDIPVLGFVLNGVGRAQHGYYDTNEVSNGSSRWLQRGRGRGSHLLDDDVQGAEPDESPAVTRDV